MEDSQPDLEELCADLTAQIEDKTDQLQELGRPVDPAFQSHFFTELANKSGNAKLSVLKVRLRYLNSRLEKLASGVAPPLPGRELASPSPASPGRELASPSPASGGAPHLPAVVSSNRPGPSTNKSVKLEAVHDDDDSTTYAASPTWRTAPQRPNKYGCKAVFEVNLDNRPCIMSPFHVAFAKFCVRRLKQDRSIRSKTLIHLWNVNKSVEWSRLLMNQHSGAVFNRGTGMATYIFSNGVFRVDALQKMAIGALPLPVPPSNIHPDVLKLVDGSSSSSEGEGEQASGKGGDGRGAAAVGGATVVSAAAAAGPAMRKRKDHPPADGREERDGAGGGWRR